jgi:hypothetical protein
MRKALTAIVVLSAITCAEPTHADKLVPFFIVCNAGHCTESSSPKVSQNGMRPVKWGSAHFGSGVTITYAFAMSVVRFPHGIPNAHQHCDGMMPLNKLLAARSTTLNRVKEKAAEAFERWATIADITFTAVDDEKDADIIIGELEYPPGEPGWTNLDVRHSETEETDTIKKAAICFNPDAGSDSPLELPFPIDMIIGHEIGHAIGLGHPGTRGALMGFKPGPDPTLRSVDAEAAQILYGLPVHK